MPMFLSAITSDVEERICQCIGFTKVGALSFSAVLPVSSLLADLPTQIALPHPKQEAHLYLAQITQPRLHLQLNKCYKQIARRPARRAQW